MLPKLPAGLSARMPCHDEFYMTINNETYFFRRNLIAGPIWSVAMVFLIWVNLSVLYNNYRNQQQASLKITTYPKWMFWVVLQFSFLYFFMIWVGEFFVGSWNGSEVTFVHALASWMFYRLSARQELMVLGQNMPYQCWR